MPANPDRKLVMIRLPSDIVTKLNALVGDKTRAAGKIIHRSEVIADLIAKGHAELAPSGRRKRTG